MQLLFMPYVFTLKNPDAEKGWTSEEKWNLVFTVFTVLRRFRSFTIISLCIQEESINAFWVSVILSWNSILYCFNK